MAENTGNRDVMDCLKALISTCPSGLKLITALEAQSLGNTEIPKLAADVVKEYSTIAKGAGAVEVARLSMDDALSVIPSQMFVVPRGKQDFGFFPQHMLIKTSKNDIVVPYSAVRNLVILDCIPKDTKGRVLLYLHLESDPKIMNGKQALNGVCIQLLADAQLSIKHPQEPKQQLEGIAAVIMCQVFGLMGIDGNLFSTPNKELFESSEGHIGVEAFVKARQGWLFPLASGLCFLESPAMFIPMPSIKSVELARANGASSTFDFYIYCKDGATHEFSNLSRNEIGTIQEYIRKAKLSVGTGESSDEEEESGSDGEERKEGESDTDDPEDEDFNPGSDIEEERPKKKARKLKNKQPDEAANNTATDTIAPASVKKMEEGPEEGGQNAGEEIEEEASYEDSESSDDDSDSDSDGSVELVSEDEFSTGALRNMMDSEKRT